MSAYEKFESNIDFNIEYNWLKNIFRKPDNVTHPVRHLLLTKYLCGNIKNLMNESNISHNEFGEGPWPCLNPCCKNYRKLVIKECKITADYKTRKPIGTFADTCGFIYSRKPEDNIFRAASIKEFGQVWEDKLKQLICNRGTIRAIAREMRCDPKTVIKYADKFNMKYMFNSKMKYGSSKSGDLRKGVSRDEYRSDISNIIKNNVNISRQIIKKNLYKQFMWLYRNDKEWLYENLPEPKKNINNRKSKNMWDQRDIEILNMLKAEYKKLHKSKELKRVTISLLGRKINKLALLEKKIDKLPRTKKYLNKITESIEDYECRRVDIICKHLYDDRKILKEWEVIKLCGLKSSMPDRVKDRIKYNISLYN